MHTRWSGTRSPSDRVNEFPEVHMYAHNRETNAQRQYIGTQFKNSNLKRYAILHKSSSSAAERFANIKTSQHPSLLFSFLICLVAV